jgi:beta-glucosidase
MQRARDAGVPVIGYLYWSLTDNYEFGSYTSRFGLYTVDVRTDRSLSASRPTPCRSTGR